MRVSFSSRFVRLGRLQTTKQSYKLRSRTNYKCRNTIGKFNEEWKTEEETVKRLPQNVRVRFARTARQRLYIDREESYYAEISPATDAIMVSLNFNERRAERH